MSFFFLIDGILVFPSSCPLKTIISLIFNKTLIVQIKKIIKLTGTRNNSPT